MDSISKLIRRERCAQAEVDPLTGSINVRVAVKGGDLAATYQQQAIKVVLPAHQGQVRAGGVVVSDREEVQTARGGRFQHFELGTGYLRACHAGTSTVTLCGVRMQIAFVQTRRLFQRDPLL